MQLVMSTIQIHKRQMVFVSISCLTLQCFLAVVVNLIFGAAGEASWERTSTCRSYGGRSSQMWWGFCSACGAGSTVSCPPFTGLQDPPDPIKPADWDTSANKVSDESSPLSGVQVHILAACHFYAEQYVKEQSEVFAVFKRFRSK